jgi:uncharacterized cupin superfamily protein
MKPESTMTPVVVAPGQGRFIPVGTTGLGVMLKASGAETGALFSVWESRVGPGTVGAGLHYHRARDEFFYIVSGEFVLRIGDAEHTAPAGTCAFVPRGTVHGFRNASQADASILVVHTPSGFEHYFEEMQQLLARQAGKEEREALGARYDVFPPPV